jgi:hypothetical protein
VGDGVDMAYEDELLITYGLGYAFEKSKLLIISEIEEKTVLKNQINIMEEISSINKFKEKLYTKCNSKFPNDYIINIEEALKTNYITFCLRDNDAAIMLSTIFKNPVIDIGTIYSEGYDRLSFLSDETILEAVNNDEAFSYLSTNNMPTLEKLNSEEFR